MSSPSLYKLALFYALSMILCGFGYAKYDNYKLDGDAVAFMDIADRIHTHQWAEVVNGYWNPAYAGALAVGQAVAHPSRFNELQTYFYVNFVIFVLCTGAMWFFVESLTRVRELFQSEMETMPAFSRPALLLVGLGLLFSAFQRELPIGAVRSDGLLLLFLLLASGFLLRLQSSGRFIYYLLLGVSLGFAYLTKSFAFLPSGILLAALFIYGLTRSAPRRRRIVPGVLVAATLFIALAAPYIAGISRQRGRFTTGESARLNYCFFVDSTGRWHEWHSGDLGQAKADFKHHEQLLIGSPPVYSYVQHPLGTYPLWFDPSYWTDTLKPVVYWPGHIRRLERTSMLLVRYVAGHLEAFVLLGALLLLGCALRPRTAPKYTLLPVLFWGLLMLGIYFPIDLQDRYLTGAFFFVVLPLLAMIRRPQESALGQIATGMALVFAGLILATAIGDLGERRRVESVTGYPRGAYSKQIYPASIGLNDLGIGPGSTVACMGDDACYVDHYWARLAGTPIRAEVEVPDGSDPGAFWKKVADKPAVYNALRTQGVKALIGIFAPSTQAPEGWRQLESSNFYAYLL